MDFSLDESVKNLRKYARNLCEKQISNFVRGFEARREIPDEVIKSLSALGLDDIEFSQADLILSLNAYLEVILELSYWDASVGLVI